MDLPPCVRAVYRTDTEAKSAIILPEVTPLEDVIKKAKQLGALVVVERINGYHLKYLCSNTENVRKKLALELANNLINKKYTKRVAWLVF